MPGLSRWLSRDPIGEMGGANLYAMVGNDAVGNYDYMGLWWGETPEEKAFNKFRQNYDKALDRCQQSCDERYRDPSCREQRSQ